MANQEFYSRIIHKHDIEENWIKAVNFIPKQGEIIVYDIDNNYNYERMKIGDGIHNVNDLSFIAASKTTADASGNVITDTYMTIVNPTGTGSFSMGRKANTEIGENSHAEGYETTASGECSHAEGRETIASGDNSHAEGDLTIAMGNNSHAEGYASGFLPNNITIDSTNDEILETRIGTPFTLAKGQGSHAEGLNTIALGISSHAEGWDSFAIGDDAHAEGRYTIAFGSESHAEGQYTVALGMGSHAEGVSQNKAPNNITSASTREEIIDAWNNNPFTLAKVYGSHAEGYSTLSLGTGSHAEGMYTIASENDAHAEGWGTVASGSDSHAEGLETIAYSDQLHVQGRLNKVEEYSTTFVEEIYENESITDVLYDPDNECYQVFNSYTFDEINGIYIANDPILINIEDNTNYEEILNILNNHNYLGVGEENEIYAILEKVEDYYLEEDNIISINNTTLRMILEEDSGLNGRYAHIVGNGYYDYETDEIVRSNAHTLDWDGNAWFAGDVYVGGTSQDDGKKLVTEDDISCIDINLEGASAGIVAPVDADTLGGKPPEYYLGGSALEPTGVTAGTYGKYGTSAQGYKYYHIPNVTVDECGRITDASDSYLGLANDKSDGLMTTSMYQYICNSSSIVNTIFTSSYKNPATKFTNYCQSSSTTIDSTTIYFPKVLAAYAYIYIDSEKSTKYWVPIKYYASGAASSASVKCEIPAEYDEYNDTTSTNTVYAIITVRPYYVSGH